MPRSQLLDVHAVYAHSPNSDISAILAALIFEQLVCFQWASKSHPPPHESDLFERPAKHGHLLDLARIEPLKWPPRGHVSSPRKRRRRVAERARVRVSSAGGILRCAVREGAPLFDSSTAAGVMLGILPEVSLMAKRVNLDAMIPREDFAVQGEETTVDLLRDFPITYLEPNAPILKLLRKPDFQRETNHWTPDQVVTFIASFLDSEVIPSLILWKSSTYIFVIDGGHRLSALRAWMEDDYGDGPHSSAFYKSEISDDQRKTAKRTRDLIEKTIGRFTTLKNSVDSTAGGCAEQTCKGTIYPATVIAVCHW